MHPNGAQRAEGISAHERAPQGSRALRPVRFAALLLSCALCLMTATGCWDRREVNDIAIVLAISLDKEPNGMIRLGIQVPLVSNLGGPSGGGGGTSGEKQYQVDSDVGRTVFEANRKLQVRMSRQIYYAHHRVVIIGEELANEGAGRILDIISRFPENRLSAYMVLAKGRALDLLQEQPDLERFSGEAIRELVKAKAIPVTFRDFAHQAYAPGIDPILPVFQVVPPKHKGKSTEIETVGVGMFRKDKLVSLHVGGKKGDDIANSLIWFHHRFVPITYDLTVDGARFSFVVNEGRAKILPVLQNGKIHFQIQLNGLAILLENLSDWNFDDSRVVDKLERKINERIEHDVRLLIDIIKSNKADAIGLGLAFARQYPKEWKENYRTRWDEELPEISCEVEAAIKLGNIGQTTKNLMEE